MTKLEKNNYIILHKGQMKGGLLPKCKIFLQYKLLSGAQKRHDLGKTNSSREDIELDILDIFK